MGRDPGGRPGHFHGLRYRFRDREPREAVREHLQGGSFRDRTVAAVLPAPLPVFLQAVTPPVGHRDQEGGPDRRQPLVQSGPSGTFPRRAYGDPDRRVDRSAGRSGLPDTDGRRRGSVSGGGATFREECPVSSLSRKI